jgi:hypothetical protein
VTVLPCITTCALQAQSRKILQVCPAWFSSIRVQGAVSGASSQQQQFAVEFLSDPAFQGNVYLHGILFKHLHGLAGMGINYCGSTQLLMNYELNRDRNSADVSRLVTWLVLQAVVLLHAQAAPSGPFLQTPDGRLAFLVAQLFPALTHQRAEDYGVPFYRLGNSYKPTSSSERRQFKLLADLLGCLLGVAEGVQDKHPVPVTGDTSAKDKAELQLLGYTPVTVRDLSCN